MRLWRVIALLLVLAVGAGPALLDPCLLGCHEPAEQAAVPSCHESHDTTGTSIASTAGCGHDHTGIDADSPLEWRSASPRHLDQPLALPEASAGASIQLGSSRLVLLPQSALSPPLVLRPQLRL